MISPSAYGSIHEIGDQIRARTESPVTAVAACLQRIEQLNPALNAFATVLADESLEEARHAEAEINAGRWLGALHGIPIGIKDFYDTAGVRTTAAARQFLNRIPSSDAELVARLKRAGAIIIGKTNMHELGMGTTSLVSAFRRSAFRQVWMREACHSLYRSSAGRGRTARCSSWLTHS